MLRRRFLASRGDGCTWRTTAVRTLYSETIVFVRWSGATSKNVLPVTAGIKQGCPSSGSLWAISYAPVVRALAAASPRRDACLGVFAGDLGLVVRALLPTTSAVAPVFEDMAAVANPRLNGRKSQLVCFGKESAIEVKSFSCRRCSRILM